MYTANINPSLLQSALLRNMVQNQLSGTGNTAKVTADQTSAAMKQRLASGEAYRLKEMNAARITDMANRLALAQGYLGIDQGKLGLDTQRLGLETRRLGLDTSKLGLAQQQEAWQEKNWRKNYDTESNNLWKTAAFGLGTAGWSAYEGNRRATETRANTEAQKSFYDRMGALLAAQQARKTPIAAGVGYVGAEPNRYIYGL